MFLFIFVALLSYLSFCHCRWMDLAKSLWWHFHPLWKNQTDGIHYNTDPDLIQYTEPFWVGDQSGQHNSRSGTNVLTHMEHEVYQQSGPSVSITKGCHSANFLCLSLVLRSIHTYLSHLRRWLARLRSVNQFILYYIVYLPEKWTRESRAYIAFLCSSLSTLSITQSYFTWWRYTNNANKNMYTRQLDRDLNRESCM